MNMRVTFFCLLLLGFPVNGRSDDSIENLLERYRGLPNEAEKAKFVPVINRAALEQIEAARAAASGDATESTDRSIHDLVAKTFRSDLDAAKSLELVSILSHSWWMFEDHEKDLSPETRRLVFAMLDDVRTSGLKATPTTPRERAIYVLSSCTDAVEDDVIALLDHEKAMHRAAAIRILSARGHFEDNFERLASLANSEVTWVQKAVANALAVLKSHHEEAIDVGLKMLRPGDAAGEVALALARHVGEVDALRAAEVQDALITGLPDIGFSSTYRRAIHMTMPHLSAADQRSAVSKLIPHLNAGDPWIERAVSAAGTAASEALPYFQKTFEEADDRTKLRRAADLWKIERNSKRVLPVFMEALESPRPTERWYGFSGLRTMGSSAEPAVPKLTQLLASENTIIVRLSLQALAKTETTSDATLAAIEKVAAHHENERLRELAMQTLQTLRGEK